ncbi:tyrosine-type recombinase/integrase [Methylomonas sp. AM2-LC]|jgi:integrase|uniref:tyrosine-type recombinase/integrase n=1 Tax=Methylomonas sp. AM2-LC TaxID=3153301 RepID=UPI003265E3C7
MKSNFWKLRVEAYLVHRHSLGYKLSIDETVLNGFARYADDQGDQYCLTLELAVQWARQSKRSQPITWARRLEVLRGFARFCLRIDPATVIPPIGLFGPAHRRLIPHIYTEAELIALLNATDNLVSHHGLRPATCRTVFGLLASSGLRISEATSLTCSEVDLDDGVLYIHETKFLKSRWVPLHPSTTQSLIDYAKLRNQIISHPACNRFFLSDEGQPIKRANIMYALHSICQEFGWKPRGDYVHHRLHDFRHTFIVHSMLRFYQQGIDVDHAVLALSTYVGHARISDTYWYFTGIPELMSIAAERFERYSKEISNEQFAN